MRRSPIRPNQILIYIQVYQFPRHTVTLPPAPAVVRVHNHRRNGGASSCHLPHKRKEYPFFSSNHHNNNHQKKTAYQFFYFNSIEFHGRLENDLVLSRSTPLRSTGFDQRTWPVEEDEDDQSPPPLSSDFLRFNFFRRGERAPYGVK